MFELDGEQFDLATVTAWADDDNKTVDEYVKSYGLTPVKKQRPRSLADVGTGSMQTSENQNGESDLADGLSDAQNLIEVEVDGFKGLPSMGMPKPTKKTVVKYNKNKLLNNLYQASGIKEEEIKNTVAEEYFKIKPVKRLTPASQFSARQSNPYYFDQPTDQELQQEWGQEKFQEYKKYKEEGVIPNFNKDYLQGKKISILEQRSNDYLKTLSPQERKATRIALEQDVELLNNVKEDNDAFQEKKAKVEELAKNKAPEAQKELEAAVYELNDEYEQLKTKYASLKRYEEDTMPLSVGLATAELNFNIGEKTIKQLEKSIVGNIAKYGAMGIEAFVNDDNILLDTKAKALEAHAIEYYRGLGKEIDETFYKPTSIDNVTKDNIGRWALETLGDNALSIGLAMYSGGTSLAGRAALKQAVAAGADLATKASLTNSLIASANRAKNISTGVFFGTTAGDQYDTLELAKEQADLALPLLYSRLKEAATDEDKADIEQQIDYYISKQKSSKADMAVSAMLYGTVEGAAERLGSLSAVEKILDFTSMPGVRNHTKRAIGAATGIALGGAIETGEEVVTKGLQNLADIAIFKENKSIIDGIDKDLVASTLITSLAIGSPAHVSNFANIVKSQYAHTSLKKENAALRDELTELGAELNQNKDLTKYQKSKINKRRNEILGKLAKNDVIPLVTLNSLSKTDVATIESNSLEQNRIKEGLADLVQSNLSSEIKKRRSNELVKEYNDLQSAKDNIILENSKPKFKSQLQEEIGKPRRVTDAETSYLWNIYQAGLLVASSQAEVIELDTIEKLREYALKESMKESTPEERASKRKKFESAYGWIGANGEIVINSTLIEFVFSNQKDPMSAKELQYVATTPIEELTHKKLAKDGIVENGVLKASVQKAFGKYENLLAEKLDQKRISKEQYDALIDRINIYDPTSNAFVEEALVQINNAIYLGVLNESDLDLNYEFKSFVNSLLKYVSPSSDLFININNSKDIINFLKNYNRSYQAGKGKLAGDEERREGVFSKAAEKEAELYELFASGEIDTTEFYSRLEAIEQGVEEPVKKEVKKETRQEKKDNTINEKTELSAISKKAMDIYTAGMEGVSRPEYLSKYPLPSLLESKLVKLFEGYITTVARSQFKQIEEEAITLDDAISILRAEIPSALRTFNPAKNNDIAGWVKSIISRRKSLIFKDVNTQFDADIEGMEETFLGGESAESAIRDSEKIAQEKEVSKKSISESIKIDDALTKELKDSIAKYAALNIKKLKDSISKNRTITPFVADLKMDLANALEKSFVDYIKKYGVEKFLTENRVAFLENMTTTYLSKHPVFRKGILKRVNGKWTAPVKVGKEKYDWVDDKGKKLKIDRDSAAGRGLTSGPELIKRNPNIATVLSEAEFVDYHFMDGAKRRVLKQNPLLSVARQFASELGFEVLADDLKNQGPILEGLADRADIYNIIIDDIAVESLIKDFERGEIKFSRASAATIKAFTNLMKSGMTENEKDALMAGDNYSKLRGTAERFYNVKGLDSSISNDTFEDIIDDIYPESVFSKKAKQALIAVLRSFRMDLYQSPKDRVKNKEEFSQEVIKGLYKASAFKSKKDEITQEILEEDKIKITLDDRLLTDRTIVGLINYYMLSNPKETKQDSFNSAVEFVLSSSQEALTLPYGNNKTIFDVISKIALEIGNFNMSHFKLSNGKITYKSNNELVKSAVAGQEANSVISGNKRYTVLSNYKNGLNSQDVPIDIQSRHKNAKTNEKIFVNFVNVLKEAYAKKAINDDMVNLLLRYQSARTRSTLKAMGKIRYVAFLPGVKSDVKFVYEHLIPASRMAEIAGNYIRNLENSEAVFNKAIENNYVSITQISIDKKLTTSGLRSNMPPGSNILSKDFNPLDRTANSVIFNAVPNMVIIDLMDPTTPYSKENYTTKFSAASEKSMNSYFNGMLERKKGIASTEEISEVTARLMGAGKGKYNVFVPASAEDFEGLLYQFIGAGEQGDIDKIFFEEGLLKPLAEANYQLNQERQVLKRKYADVVKRNKGILKELRKESNYKFYTNDSAVRVYMWSKLGYEIPGLYQADIVELKRIVESDPKLLKFAQEMISLPSKNESWQQPDEHWAAGSVEYDLQQTIDKIGRKRIFAKFIENKNLIFSTANLNKIEAAYGTKFRKALEDMLYRIERGKARELGSDSIANAYLNWIRGSVAVTMFLNTRSALLQQLSLVNFTNWSDNNPIAQAKAHADIKQWASDFAMLWNSDWMKERREGLKTDINESELISALESNRNKPKALLHWLLTQGFSLTKYGDNFAISFGGSAFYRNRVNTYLKRGLTKERAERKAFLDFQELAERTQQSSRQDLLSNQQVSVAGRLFLAFQNTPMQMTRLTKKAILDLVNGRGSKRENISRIVYYSTIQNIIFSFFQNALFAIAGLDEEEDEKLIDTKTERAINNVLDGVLKGAGIGGAAISTIKNVLIQVKKQEEAGWKGDDSYILLEAANIAPPIGIKARRFYGAYKNYKINKNIISEVPLTNLEHPAYGIVGSLSGAAFNVPLDRLLSKVNNLVQASNSELEAWQRVSLFLGYNTWDLGIQNEEIKEVRARVKEERAKSKKKKRKIGI